MINDKIKKSIIKGKKKKLELMWVNLLNSRLGNEIEIN